MIRRIAANSEKHARLKLSEVFGGGKVSIPPGLTIAQAIKEERTSESNRIAKEAEAKTLEAKVRAEKEAVAKQISDILTVALISKKYLPSDYKSGNVHDSIQIDLAFENKGKKDITGVKGKTFFKDIFGDVVKVVNLSYDEGIPAQQSITWNGSLKYNQFDEKDVKLRSVDIGKLGFSFEPEVVIFSDGTRLPASNEPK